MSEIKERLKEYADYSGLSMRQLEQKCLLKRGAFSGKSESIKSDSLSNLFDICHDLNILWLFSGKGEMINKETERTEEISSRALSILENQLEVKDKQISELTDIIKKGNALQVDIAECAAATGSGERL